MTVKFDASAFSEREKRKTNTLLVQFKKLLRSLVCDNHLPIGMDAKNKNPNATVHPKLAIWNEFPDSRLVQNIADHYRLSGWDVDILPLKDTGSEIRLWYRYEPEALSYLEVSRD